MFRTLLLASLPAALATIAFTTTMDFRDWLLGEESVEQYAAFGFQGSIANIEQNRTTVHAQFDADSGDLATKYNLDGTNSFTFTFAPGYVSARIAKPAERETTFDVDCSATGSTANTTCTVFLWGVDFSASHCTGGASETSSELGCQNGTRSNTWTDGSELMTAQWKQVVLTAGLEKLGASATEAILQPTGTAATGSATVGGPRETGGGSSAGIVDVALVCVGAAAAVVMS